MRLGDLDVLKEELKQYFSDGTLDSVSAKLAFNMILRKIDEAPTVARTQGEWIPIKYRPLTAKDGNGDWDGVDAWMPKPEPYKKGGME